MPIDGTGVDICRGCFGRYWCIGRQLYCNECTRYHLNKYLGVNPGKPVIVVESSTHISKYLYHNH